MMRLSSAQGSTPGAPGAQRASLVTSEAHSVSAMFTDGLGNGGLDAWDVDRLIELTNGLPKEEVRLADLPEIDTVYWFDECEHPTVRKVVEHFQLLQAVDPAYPVILGPDNRVMDGMHRIARALLEGKTTIRAVRLRQLPEPDYRRCQPDELPYDR